MRYMYLTGKIVNAFINSTDTQELLEELLEQNPSSLRNDSAIQVNLKIIASACKREYETTQEPLFGRVRTFLSGINPQILEEPSSELKVADLAMHRLDLPVRSAQDYEKMAKKMSAKNEEVMAWLLDQHPMPMNLWEGLLQRAVKWSPEDRVWLLYAYEKVNDLKRKCQNSYFDLLIQTPNYPNRGPILAEHLREAGESSLLRMLQALSKQALESEINGVLNQRLSKAQGKLRNALMKTLFIQDERAWPWDQLEKSLLQKPDDLPEDLLEAINENLNEKNYVPLRLLQIADRLLEKGGSINSRQKVIPLLNGLRHRECIERVFQCIEKKTPVNGDQLKKLLETTLALNAPGPQLLNYVSKWLANLQCKDFFDELNSRFISQLFTWLALSPDFSGPFRKIEEQLQVDLGAMNDYRSFALTKDFGEEPDVISPQSMINSSIETLRLLLASNAKNSQVLSDFRPLSVGQGVKLYFRNKQDKVKFLEKFLEEIPKDPVAQTFFSLYARMLTLRWMKSRVIPMNNGLLNFKVSVLPVYPLRGLGLLQRVGYLYGYKIERKRYEKDPLNPDNQSNKVIRKLYDETVQTGASQAECEETAEKLKQLINSFLNWKAFHGVILAHSTVNRFQFVFPKDKFNEVRGLIRATCLEILKSVSEDAELLEKYCALDPIFAEARRSLE